MLSRRNPAPALEKTKSALAASEVKIERLIAERAVKLIETDDLAPVQALDRAIESERQAAAIHADRINILEAELRRQDWELRERERLDAIEKILAPRVARCEALAKEIDVTLSNFCAAWTALLDAARGINVEWPAAVPRPPAYAYFSVHDATNRVAVALGPGRNEWGHPLPVDAERIAQLARRVGSVAEPVATAGSSFLQRVRATVLPEPEASTADEAA